ncbi:UDP-N-acetyl-D-mannosaminuronic acid transferase [Roseivivax jejudonensis]|uniref:UDP-N-acetyl-D-mannosaminuronic acid transferase n=1 Tax=Roseivivax jejudonensis TaxID=1529041 RepID=A0A1X6YID5_9RHOB|nr:WecB/TagA/CpsF family glycosyltransferase [Roseivivax jejudonensis]SLN22213.1 UDP-N-acetyl-D-mannosaminuronic acid transferase [Roseivivax jejudonensis]
MEYIVKACRVRITVPDWTTLSSVVSRRLAAGEGFALATLNLDHLVKLARSDRFRAAYAAQDLVTADGNPIVWTARLAGRPVDLVPGADLIVPLSRLAARHAVGVALVGSTASALDAAAAHLESIVPGLRVVARIAPPMGFDPEGAGAEAVFAELEASGAGMCFVALGAPKQEIFAAVGRRRLPGMGFAAIGAGLDFFAGTQARAPLWVRRVALEWAWRAASHPRRLVPRYAACAALLPRLALGALRQRLGARPA